MPSPGTPLFTRVLSDCSLRLAAHRTLRQQAMLGAAVELVGASAAQGPQLRVRGASPPRCGALLLGGGALLAPAVRGADPPRVQWFRSVHGAATGGSLQATDFEAIPCARSLSYTPFALDAGRLLRLVVSPAGGGNVVWAPAGDGSVQSDPKVEANAQARVETVRQRPLQHLDHSRSSQRPEPGLACRAW